MSKDLEQPTEQSEEGGIVTTVKAEESQDLDFKARLKQLKEEAGETTDEPEPKKEEKPKAAKADDEPSDDWQKTLTPEQRREVNRLYKDNKATKRQLRELNEKLETIATKLADKGDGAAAPPAARKTLERPKRPDPLTFKGTKEEFEAAEERYEDDFYEYRKQLEVQQSAKAAQDEADRKTVQRFNAQVDEFAVANPDYEETMEEADNEVDDEMFGAIIQEGPALGYYWAKHPAESSKIARMESGAAKTKAILKTIIKLEEAAAKETKKVEEPPPNKPKIPTPPPTVAARQAAPAKDRSKMSFKEREREYARTHPGALNYEP